MIWKTSRFARSLALIIVVGGAAAIQAQPPATAPPLGTAAQFAVLGNSGVTGSAGTGTVVNGDVGSSPTATITNFPPSRTSPPFIVHATNDGVVQQAHADAQAAFTNMTNQGPGLVRPADLSGAILGPGIYSFTGGAAILANNATLTLNGDGIFIFNTASTLTMNTGSSVVGTASPCNIFWRVGSSATLLGTNMRGTVVADASITIGDGANLVGRALAGTGPTGAVTMAGNGGNIVGGCSSASATPTPAPGGTGASCPNPASLPPTITTMNPQSVPVGGNITVFFTVSGSQIPNALQVIATSSDLALVPLSGLVVTQPSLGGETTVSITPAAGASGSTTISVRVRDPNTDCVNVAAFVLSVGAAAVPTLAQWAVIALALLLMFAGYKAIQRRPAQI